MDCTYMCDFNKSLFPFRFFKIERNAGWLKIFSQHCILYQDIYSFKSFILESLPKHDPSKTTEQIGALVLCLLSSVILMQNSVQLCIWKWKPNHTSIHLKALYIVRLETQNIIGENKTNYRVTSSLHCRNLQNIVKS